LESITNELKMQVDFFLGRAIASLEDQFLMRLDSFEMRI
jgi:hypothetical protein